VDLNNYAGTVIRDEMGLSLEKAGKEVLGSAIKVVITKDSTLIVTDGSTCKAVEERVSQIRRLVEVQLLSLAAVVYFLL
jgi:chaperonin GroEL